MFSFSLCSPGRSKRRTGNRTGGYLCALVSCLTVAGLVAWAPIQVFSADSVVVKNDIADPVLQEVITSFTGRMPRFVNKHGQSLFVSDEPVTRGSLLLAIYEYDKSLKLPKKELISRQEFDDLRGRLLLLEKNSFADNGSAARSSQVDMARLINDLQSNLPVLLDNTLEKSRVFLQLKSDVERGLVVGVGNMGSVSSPAPEISRLERRIERLEKTGSVSQGGYGGGQASSDVNTVMSKVALELPDLIDRNMERSKTITDIKNELARRQNISSSIVGELNQTRLDLVQLQKKVEQIDDRPSGSPSSVSDISQASLRDYATRKELNELRGKLTVLESSLPVSDDMVQAKSFNALKSELTKRQSASNELLDDLGQAHVEIAQLQKRMEKIEKANGYSAGEGSAGSLTSTAFLTRISFGLSMLAAFFIAR